MAALAQTAHTAFTVVKYLGVLYLLYLAYRMWTAAPRPLGDEVVVAKAETAPRLFAGTLALTLGNPKVMVFFMALLPTVIDLQGMTVSSYAQIAAAMFMILTCVLTAYSVAALPARRFFRDARAVQWLNRASGTVMAGAAAGIAAQ